jgi:hypothetical protein
MNKNTDQIKTVLNSVMNFRSIRSEAFANGLKYEVEVGNSDTQSEFAWFATEDEARAALVKMSVPVQEMCTKFEAEHDEVQAERDPSDREEYSPYFDISKITLLGTDEDGGHDANLDEEL